MVGKFTQMRMYFLFEFKPHQKGPRTLFLRLRDQATS